jgi:excisionase family DNA binding protein
MPVEFASNRQGANLEFLFPLPISQETEITAFRLNGKNIEKSRGNGCPRVIKKKFRTYFCMVNQTNSNRAAKTIYTTHEVSRLLHVNPRSVINWIEQNLLPSYRTPGGHRRIRHDDLLAFLRKHQIPTPASLVEGGFTVLVVDDEQEIVELIRNYFQRHGSYEVVTASDGISALLEVGRVKPDLLILDIMIPGVDGIEVCRRIKNDPSNKTVIIAVSGTADKEKKALQAGADAFMPKPVDLDKLHAEALRLLRVL